jgi:hypothetical protein
MFSGKDAFYIGQLGHWTKGGLRTLDKNAFNKDYGLIDMFARQHMTLREKWQRTAGEVCRQIEELVNAWSLGIKLANDIDVNAHGCNGQKGSYVRLDKICGPEADFESYSYAMIWPKAPELIEIQMGGECFKEKDPKTIQALSQFDYQIVLDNDSWRENQWDLRIYIKKPEDVTRVLVAIEPHWDWDYV